MRRPAIIIGSVVLWFGDGRFAQESRSEISLQGTGFFTKDARG